MDIEEIKPGMSVEDQRRAASAIRGALRPTAATEAAKPLDADALLAKPVLTDEDQRALARDILRWAREGAD